MHPDLVHLDAANQLDRQLLELKKQKRKLDAALAAAEKANIEAIAEHTRLRDEAAANAQRQHELQRSIEKYEARRQSAVRVLENGTGDPDAAERQVQGCSEQLDALETDLLECMENADSLATAVVSAARHEVEAAATLSELTEAHEPAIAALRSKFDSILPLRDAQLDELDRGTREKYILVRDRKGYAVAPIIAGGCKGCSMMLPNQQLADLRRGLLIPCRGCGRWLVPGEAS